MEEKAAFKNKINVFYVTIPSENEDEHTFVNTINIEETEQIANISFYTSFINIDETSVFAKIRYAMTNNHNNAFSGFTEPFAINKIPNTVFTSFDVAVDFVLQSDTLACFEIQLLKKSANENFEILDSKECYAEIKLIEDVQNGKS